MYSLLRRAPRSVPSLARGFAAVPAAVAEQDVFTRLASPYPAPIDVSASLASLPAAKVRRAMAPWPHPLADADAGRRRICAATSSSSAAGRRPPTATGPGDDAGVGGGRQGASGSGADRVGAGPRAGGGAARARGGATGRVRFGSGARGSGCAGFAKTCIVCVGFRPASGDCSRGSGRGRTHVPWGEPGQGPLGWPGARGGVGERGRLEEGESGRGHACPSQHARARAPTHPLHFPRGGGAWKRRRKRRRKWKSRGGGRGDETMTRGQRSGSTVGKRDCV